MLRTYPIHMLFISWFFSVLSPNVMNSYIFSYKFCTLNWCENDRLASFWSDLWIGERSFVSILLLQPIVNVLQPEVADYWVAGRGWKWEILHNVLPIGLTQGYMAEVADYLLRLDSIEISTDPWDEDTAIWGEMSSGNFTASSDYNLESKLVRTTGELGQAYGQPRCSNGSEYMCGFYLMTASGRTKYEGSDTCPQAPIVSSKIAWRKIAYILWETAQRHRRSGLIYFRLFRGKSLWLWIIRIG